MIQIFAGYYPEHKGLYQELYRMTQGIRIIYPNYETWYRHTFLEGLKRGERRYLIASRHGHLTGCCLLKNTPMEKKICTLFVAPEFRGQGIGTELLHTALEELNGATNITVSEINREKMIPLLQRFDFRFSHLFLNGSFEEFEYTRPIDAKPIARQRQKLFLKKIQDDSHQH